MISFFCVLVSLYLAHASVAPCTGTVPFNKPFTQPFIASYPNPKYFLPELFPDNFQCEYQINVNDGWFAQVRMTLNSTVAMVPVTVISQNSENVSTASYTDFYFTNNGRILLNTKQGKVFFGFQVEWKQYSNSPPMFVRVNQSDTIPYMQPIRHAATVIVTADTRVSMTVVTSSAFMNLRGVLIFDGSEFLGTAYTLLMSNTQYVSSGNTMKVQILNNGSDYFLPTLIWQDYENTKDIKEFLGASCMANHNCGVFSMDASKGAVAIQSVAYDYKPLDDILMSVEGAGTLDVYMGGVTKDKKNSIAIYNAATSSTYLPQQFLGPLKTYVLSYGHANVNITRNHKSFGTTKEIPRKGFIQSTYYGQLSNKQHAGGDILAPIGMSEAKFKVKIGFAGVSGNTYFEISGTKNGVKTFDQIFNSTNLPDLKNGYTVTGDTLTVYYDSLNSYTNGLFLRFEVAQP